jgi:succinyl-diaminopimelate desuccinylase
MTPPIEAAGPPDLLARTAELVDVPSESFSEGRLVELLEAELRGHEHLDVTRVGDNLVARTSRGCAQRVVLAGHTDTVPANGNATARIEGDTLFGVGAADMKSGLAVMLESARRHAQGRLDVTYVFYAREEVASEHSGLGELRAARPDLLDGDLALLGEPTDGAIEAGCQGSIRATVTLHGERAHTARAWMGRNAVHRLGALLVALDGYEPRQPEIQGCRFREALLAVGVEGGVSGNVVPDRAVLTVAHRFAPDRSAAEAEDHLRAVLAPHLDAADEVEVLDVAPAAHPSLDQPLLAALVGRHGLDVRSKLGWTDVARFAALGVPAANFGPGDPTIAHTAGEHVTRDSIERVWRVIDELVTAGL